MMQTINEVYRMCMNNFLTVLLVLHWNLQDLRGVKGTDQCWLLPGALTGRESTDKYSAYVTEHPVIKYFQANFANFLNDFSQC